jgi:hypothetical protein
VADIIKSVKRGGGEKGGDLQHCCFLSNVYIDDLVIRDNGSSIALYIPYDKSAKLSKSYALL